jgi:hypothetical protein
MIAMFIGRQTGTHLKILRKTKRKSEKEKKKGSKNEKDASLIVGLLFFKFFIPF